MREKIIKKIRKIQSSLILRAKANIPEQEFQFGISFLNTGNSIGLISNLGILDTGNCKLNIKIKNNDDDYFSIPGKSSINNRIFFIIDEDNNTHNELKCIHSEWEHGTSNAEIILHDNKGKRISGTFLFRNPEEGKKKFKGYLNFLEKQQNLPLGANKPHALLFGPHPAQSLLLNFWLHTFLADDLKISRMFARWAGTNHYLQNFFGRPIPINKDRTLATK